MLKLSLHLLNQWRSSTATTVCVLSVRKASYMEIKLYAYVVATSYTASATSACCRAPTPTSCCAQLVADVPTPSPSSGSSDQPLKHQKDGEQLV